MNYKKTFGGISIFILICIIFVFLVISILASYPLLSFIKDVKLDEHKSNEHQSGFIR